MVGHVHQNQSDRRQSTLKTSSPQHDPVSDAVENTGELTSLLLDTRVPAVQRQALAVQMGQLAGNHQLQRMLLQREPDAPPKEADAKPAETEKHYSLKSSDIVLPTKVEEKVREIANNYYKKVKKDIVVTSGTRTAGEQASAMYTKLAGGDDLSVYSNKTAVEAIKKAYNDAVKEKKSKDDTIAAMTTVIQGQMDKGTYISKHLREGAVDIRNNDMSADEKAKFKEAAKEAGITPLEESTPPHFHLQVD